MYRQMHVEHLQRFSGNDAECKVTHVRLSYVSKFLLYIVYVYTPGLFNPVLHANSSIS